MIFGTHIRIFYVNQAFCNAQLLMKRIRIENETGQQCPVNLRPHLVRMKEIEKLSDEAGDNSATGSTCSTVT